MKNVLHDGMLLFWVTLRPKSCQSRTQDAPRRPTRPYRRLKVSLDIPGRHLDEPRKPPKTSPRRSKTSSRRTKTLLEASVTHPRRPQEPPRRPQTSILDLFGNYFESCWDYFERSKTPSRAAQASMEYACCYGWGALGGEASQLE